MFSIAKLSFKETLYKRIFLIAVLMTLAFLAFFGIANHYASKDMTENFDFAGMEIGQALLQNTFFAVQVLSIGLFFANFITILLTILSTVGTVSGEIESHQIDTLLARPLKRRDLILGKFIGLGGLMMLYSVFIFGGVILMNQLFGGVLAIHLSAGQIVKAGLMFALLPLLVTAIGLWLSTRLTTINGGIIMIVMYGIGFIGGFMEQFGVLMNNRSLENIGILSSIVFPLDSLFRRMSVYLFDVADNPLSFASQGIFASASTPSNLMLVYSALYGVLILFFAIRKFTKRDV
ncbi:ABC transporter permease [Tumebacillus algifaecis]|uniref:ABC transporter permease n=1 Tax=Tumebacillus algifaecis TaxID=1214604 RepID=A0A223D6B8_9BACL|nr:ABC transporter permease subunit [Tumebacillus algifaecis]ASS76983.1 ABC transporter permease [Tumebacillus algifaecis]